MCKFNFITTYHLIRRTNRFPARSLARHIYLSVSLPPFVSFPFSKIPHSKRSRKRTMLFAARETPLFVLNGKEEREDANDRAASSGHPSTSVMRDEKGEDEEDRPTNEKKNGQSRAKCFRRYRSIGDGSLLSWRTTSGKNTIEVEVGRERGRERGEQSK